MRTFSRLFTLLVIATPATFPSAAVGALPEVAVRVATVPLANLGAHRGVTVTAGCPSGTMVGGGGYLRDAANPATLPTNGLVLGATTASSGSAPVDKGAADGAADPRHWLTNANFTGVSEDGDQAAGFALCAAGGPAHTIVKTASTVGINAAQQVDPPKLATATCPAATRLIGGGASTSTPDQINDGVTMGNDGNLKPLASYPSDAAGVGAANGSSNATSWSAWGSAGITSDQDKVTAYALCSTDADGPRVQVARVDVAGPDAQLGTTVTTASPTCPTGTRLLGGGYAVDETVGSTSGLQPQQGYHMRGSFPATGGIAEVADGAADPSTWAIVGQLGGQNLPAGDHMDTHAYAMCAVAPGPAGTADLSVTLAATPDPALTGQPITYTALVADGGPAAATGVLATVTLPAGETYDSATSTAGSCSETIGIVTCAIGSLADGASATVVITATPTQPATLTATAHVSGTPADPNASNDLATQTTTAILANRAATAIAAQASAATTVGGSISDQATLTGGTAPTGTIAFNLYGPGDSTCHIALATSSATVTGNTTYQSAPFVASAAGSYRWVAMYSGDGSNAPVSSTACDDPDQAVSVRATPTLTMGQSGAATVGSSTTGRATLDGGAVMTGTLTFDIYGPADPSCRASLASSTATVAGNGIYASRPFTPTTPGTYHWVARYGGDGDNMPAGPSSCSDPAAAMTVTGAAAPATPAAAARPAAGVATIKLGRPQADRTGRLTITVRSSGPGHLRAVATTAIVVHTSKQRRRTSTVRYGSSTKIASGTGAQSVRIAPGAHAKVLRRHHSSLHVIVAVTFTPKSGKPKAARTSLTVRSPKR